MQSTVNEQEDTKPKGELKGQPNGDHYNAEDLNNESFSHEKDMEVCEEGRIDMPNKLPTNKSNLIKNRPYI
jgi:hypothetical protein